MLWLLSPAGLVMLAFTVAPIVFLVFTSFTDYNQRSLFTGSYHVVGLQQYATMVSEPALWSALTRSILFTAAMVIGSVAVGVGVAQLLTRLASAMRYDGDGRADLRLGDAERSPRRSVWKWLFQPGYGVVNWLLTQTGLFGDMTNTDWSNDPLPGLHLHLAAHRVAGGAVHRADPVRRRDPDARSSAKRPRGSTARASGGCAATITLPFLKPDPAAGHDPVGDLGLQRLQPDLARLGRRPRRRHHRPSAIFTYNTAFVGFDIGQGAAISVVTTAILVVLTAFYIRNLVRSGEDL